MQAVSSEFGREKSESGWIGQGMDMEHHSMGHKVEPTNAVIPGQG